MTGAKAQLYYDNRMDNRYNSYGPIPEYPDNNYYNSYESDYGMDKDKKTYGTDSYESKYPSYKHDYKPAYPSYGKDDKRDKSSKDSSKSVSINKLNCINTNLNINGNNTGDINVGNKGATEEGYLGAYSSGSGGYGGGEYDSKQGKGFDCIINNNNTNNNIAGGGNQTTPKATLNVIKNVTCTYIFGGVSPESACELLEDRITENQFLIEVTDDNPVPSQFPGSESGTIVTLGAGNYVVSDI
jgi:hypothetical protein